VPLAARLTNYGRGVGALVPCLLHGGGSLSDSAGQPDGAESKVGTFSDALMAEAKTNGWTVISMKNDWKKVFPFDTN